MRWTSALLVLVLESAFGDDSKSVKVSATHGDGCTSIIVGPSGVEDGGTITSHTDDCMVGFPRPPNQL
jgi:hypothetical protein